MIGNNRGDEVRAIVADVRAALPADHAVAHYRGAPAAQRAYIDKEAARAGVPVEEFLRGLDSKRASDLADRAQERARLSAIASRARR